MGRNFGEVHVWFMTEEERLAYIKKHPIVPYEQKSGASFADIHDIQKRQKKARRGLIASGKVKPDKW